jgi:aminopeptidase N
MLEAYVGEEDFRTGVRNYMNSRLYGNARTEDLWASMQAASGQPVLEIARSFTTQPGLSAAARQQPRLRAHARQRDWLAAEPVRHGRNRADE